MSERPEQFDCAICERRIDNRWPGSKKMWPIQPLCRYCEEKWSAGAPAHGAFRDRRVARQISALANAIDTAAHHQKWGQFHAS